MAREQPHVEPATVGLLRGGKRRVVQLLLGTQPLLKYATDTFLSTMATWPTREFEPFVCSATLTQNIQAETAPPLLTRDGAERMCLRTVLSTRVTGGAPAVAYLSTQEGRLEGWAAVCGR